MTARLLCAIQQTGIILILLLVLGQCGGSRLDLTPSAPRGFVQITATTPEGKPLPGVRLEAVETPEGAILQAMLPLTDQQGQDTWGLDTPGRYTFAATATGYVSQTKQVVVQPSSTVTLDFVMVPDGS